MSRTTLIATLTLFAPSAMLAQDIGPLPLQPGSRLVIDGTSNQSDWSVEVTEMEGALWLATSDTGFDPDSVYFRTASGDLKSGKSPIMDRLMYNALKSTEHPDIVYTLGPSGVQRGADPDTTFWHTMGRLELAGVADTLYTVVSGWDDGGRYIFKGSHHMSMRQHDITPPTAMFGALHTSEWVTIGFELVFGKE